MGPILPRQNAAFELYDKKDERDVVRAMLRNELLSRLREKSLSLAQLVIFINAPRADVTRELDELLEDGILGVRENPESADSTMYYVRSSYKGGASREDRLKFDLKDYISKYISRTEEPLEFFGLILRTMRVAMINEGIDIDPVQREAGAMMGEVLYGDLKDGELKPLLGNIADFWSRHKMGRVSVEKLDPLTVVVKECFECGDLPYLGRPACSFDSGILDAVFTAHFEEPCEATETHCYAMGNDFCRFTIKKLDDK